LTTLRATRRLRRGITRLVDDAHAAATQLPQHLVAGDARGLGHGRQGGGVGTLLLQGEAPPAPSYRVLPLQEPPRVLVEVWRTAMCAAQLVLPQDEFEDQIPGVAQLRVALEVVLDARRFPRLEAAFQVGVDQLPEPEEDPETPALPEGEGDEPGLAPDDEAALDRAWQALATATAKSGSSRKRL
jgi:hypothetical protein